MLKARFRIGFFLNFIPVTSNPTYIRIELEDTWISPIPFTADGHYS
jgi:hypothetical protein